jgi:hypothetical protein
MGLIPLKVPLMIGKGLDSSYFMKQYLAMGFRAVSNVRRHMPGNLRDASGRDVTFEETCMALYCYDQC